MLLLGTAGFRSAYLNGKHWPRTFMSVKMKRNKKNFSRVLNTIEKLFENIFFPVFKIRVNRISRARTYNTFLKRNALYIFILFRVTFVDICFVLHVLYYYFCTHYFSTKCLIAAYSVIFMRDDKFRKTKNKTYVP